MAKPVIYQVLPRYFGNTRQNCVSNGSLAQNGCGKFRDFTAKALASIRDLGATHIWYTGVIEHATCTDYSAYGIVPDHPAVVKGQAGSPYAIKDYYDVDPDLAVDVARRREEFKALVDRTHRAGLKVIIDFVPNHLARRYHSDVPGYEDRDFGTNDRPEAGFSPQNNFYYLPGQGFQAQIDRQAGCEAPYEEYPVKATGNDCFSAYPSCNDWYETVKLNYGVDYQGDGRGHFDPLPDTWLKMRDILLFWRAFGVDGFRCDMAEMVPSAFWAWVIPQVKKSRREVWFIGEVYNPYRYREYLGAGFDYLYDKVGLYDTLRNIVQGKAPAYAITSCWQSLGDIKDRMLNFLENHDEQRCASDFFAGNPWRVIPALTVSCLMGVNPFMLYAGQELGERGMYQEGFSGLDGRSSIFDYWCLDSLARWNNGGGFDAENLPEEVRKLRNLYASMLRICREKAVSEGLFFDLMYVNSDRENMDNTRQYAFLRAAGDEVLLVVVNFDGKPCRLRVRIPAHAFDYLGIEPSVDAQAEDLLTGERFRLPFLPDECVSLKLSEFQGGVWKLPRTRKK